MFFLESVLSVVRLEEYIFFLFQTKTKSIKSIEKSKKEVTKPPDEKNAKEKYNFLDRQKIDTQKA